MEDKKIKDLIEESAKELAEELVKDIKEQGVDVTVSSNKSESIKKILDGLNELEGDIKPKTLVRYEFKISPVENLFFGSVSEAMIGYIEDISSLTKEDIIEIFKPVEEEFKKCGKEFAKRLNANKRAPSPEEVRKMFNELLGDNKDVN